MSIKYRIFKVNYNKETSNAAFDYKNRKTGEYYDYILEYQAKDKAHVLNKTVENSDIEYWYRVVEE